jgi:hypothetical protein
MEGEGEGEKIKVWKWHGTHSVSFPPGREQRLMKNEIQERSVVPP